MINKKDSYEILLASIQNNCEILTEFINNLNHQQCIK